MIWVGDVGQAAREEVNILQKGANYQWAYKEGTIAGPPPYPTNIIGTPKHRCGNTIIPLVTAASLAASFITGRNFAPELYREIHLGGQCFRPNLGHRGGCEYQRPFRRSNRHHAVRLRLWRHVLLRAGPERRIYFRQNRRCGRRTNIQDQTRHRFGSRTTCSAFASRRIYKSCHSRTDQYVDPLHGEFAALVGSRGETAMDGCSQ